MQLCYFPALCVCARLCLRGVLPVELCSSTHSLCCISGCAKKPEKKPTRDGTYDRRVVASNRMVKATVVGTWASHSSFLAGLSGFCRLIRCRRVIATMPNSTNKQMRSALHIETAQINVQETMKEEVLVQQYKGLTDD